MLRSLKPRFFVFFLFALSTLFIEIVAQEAADGRISMSDDQELLDALEIFQGMSPEEMEETIVELLQHIGDDDPDTKAELETLLTEVLPQLKFQSNLKEMTEDDELAAATQDALRLLSGATSWDDIWEKQDVILEGVIASGQLTPEDVALFKSDENEWKAQLKFIWDELQKQAAEAEL